MKWDLTEFSLLNRKTFKVMSKLSKKLSDIKSNVSHIRTYDADRGIGDVRDVLRNITDLLDDIIKEIEYQKTVDNNVIQ